MNFIPSGPRLLVLPDPVQEMIGRILLPDGSKEKPQRGKIVAVGQSIPLAAGPRAGETLPLLHKAGQTVCYPKYAGHDLKVDGVDYLLLNDTEILGVVTEEAAKEAVEPPKQENHENAKPRKREKATA